MKITLFITGLIFSVNLLGQAPAFKDIPKNILGYLNEMGIDESPILNGYESEYFNAIFHCSQKNFDFNGKKVGFITGSNGKLLSNKKNYFDLERDRFARNYSPNGGELYIFDAYQKKESGGYDAAIVYWNKVLVSAKDVVKSLKKSKN